MRLPRLNLLRVGAGALFLGLAGAVVALALLLNGPTGQIGGSPTSPGASVPHVGNSMASIDERVAFWEARVAANETDYSSTIALIDAYLDRVRSTGDLSDLERAEEALDRASSLAPVGDVRLLLRAGQVAFTLHEFDVARDAATEALDRDPGNETAVALLGDSSLELGDETAALEAYQELEPLAATAPVLTRLARYDLLTGDDEAAEQKMRAAIAASEVEGFAEQIASYRYQLAELLRGENRVEEAAHVYEFILQSVPDHVPSLGGLARIREAQGRRPEAIELLERATARLPTPQLVADLGDLRALDGDEDAAAESYALVERIAEVAQATGSVYDRQLTLFLADHDRRIDDAVALAESEIATRTDVYGYDALAWALYRAQRFEEADDAARQAMRLRTPDGRILYHAGLIAAALGRDGEALDLLTQAAEHRSALPPLQVPALEAAIDALGG
ncbi:MAG: tetratricopeptide repeat protein [Candidatus Limnocylindria bacterium]